MQRINFTLIELLVTVALIAMLIALALPSLQHAKESAHLTLCLSNQKQVSLAMFNYTNDNNRVFPRTPSGHKPWQNCPWNCNGITTDPVVHPRHINYDRMAPYTGVDYMKATEPMDIYTCRTAFNQSPNKRNSYVNKNAGTICPNRFAFSVGTPGPNRTTNVILPEKMGFFTCAVGPDLTWWNWSNRFQPNYDLQRFPHFGRKLKTVTFNYCQAYVNTAARSAQSYADGHANTISLETFQLYSIGSSPNCPPGSELWYTARAFYYGDNRSGW